MATQLFLQTVGTGTALGFTESRGEIQNLAGTTNVTGMLRTTRGSGVTSSTLATVAGTVTNDTRWVGSGAVTTAGARYEWFSQPIDAPVTISGTITANIWCAENNMSANAASGITVDRVDQFGVFISQIASGKAAAEMAITTNAAQNFTLTPTSTAMVAGDRIRVRLWHGDGGGTMASGFTTNIAWAGTSAAANGDTYISFTETFSVGAPSSGPLALSSRPSSTSSGASSATVTLPTGYSAGDLLVVGMLAVGASITGVATPSGWSAIAPASYTAIFGDAAYALFFYKVSSGGEGTSVAFTRSGSGNMSTSSISLAITAGTFDSGTPIGASSGAGQNTGLGSDVRVSAGSITPNSGSLLVAIGGNSQFNGPTPPRTSWSIAEAIGNSSYYFKERVSGSALNITLIAAATMQSVAGDKASGVYIDSDGYGYGVLVAEIQGPAAAGVAVFPYIGGGYYGS